MTLSEKILNSFLAKEDNPYFDEGTGFILIEDVKEFIGILPEELDLNAWQFAKLKELAGDELIK